MTYPTIPTRSTSTALAGRRLVPVVLLVSAAGGYLIFLFTQDSKPLLVGAALAISALPFVVNTHVVRHDMLSPLAIFGFTVLLGVGGQTLYLCSVSNDRTDDLLSGLNVEFLFGGLLLCVIAVASTVAGYLVPTHSPDPIFRRTVIKYRASRLSLPNVHKVRKLVVFLCFVSVVSFAALAPRVGINSLDDLLISQKRFADVGGGQTVYGYYRWANDLAGVGFIVSCYTIAVHRLRWSSVDGVVGLSALALTCFNSYVTSSRSTLLTAVAIGLLTQFLVRGTRVTLSRLVTLVLLAFVALNLLLGQRLVVQGNASSLGESVRADAMIGGVFASRDWMDVGPLSVVVERVPEHYPYQYGRTLITWLWAPIPRTVWPEKPPIRIGPEIGPPVFGFENRRTGDPPGLAGELFINGGYPVVAAGMFVYGVGLRRIAALRSRLDRRDPLPALVYSVFAVLLALRLPGDDFTGELLALVQLGAGLWFALWLVADRRDRAMAKGAR